MSAVAIPSGSTPRPGFFRVLWELIIGYLFSFFALLLPTIALVGLGIFDWNASSFREWPLRGPFPPYGVWAVSADLFCSAVVIGVSSVIIAGSMEAAVKLPVSRMVVALVVTLTGVAPFLYAQLLPATGPAALLVATLLIRTFAVDRFDSIPTRRLPRWFLLAACTTAVAGLATTASFGVIHPLWSKDAYTNGLQPTDRHARVVFSLHNAGFADVTILSVSEPARLWPPMLPSLHKRRVEGVVVPARGSRRLILLKPGCPPDDLTVRYRIFGHVMSVRLHPKPSNLHC